MVSRLLAIGLACAGLLAPAGVSAQMVGAAIRGDFPERYELTTSRLGGVVAEGLETRFGGDTRPARVRLRIVLASVDGRALARWRSFFREVQPGTTVAGTEWIPDPDRLARALSEGFGGPRTLTLGATRSIRGDERSTRAGAGLCRNATHVLLVDLAAVDDGPSGEDRGLALCLRAAALRSGVPALRKP